MGNPITLDLSADGFSDGFIPGRSERVRRCQQPKDEIIEGRVSRRGILDEIPCQLGGLRVALGSNDFFFLQKVEIPNLGSASFSGSRFVFGGEYTCFLGYRMCIRIG